MGHRLSKLNLTSSSGNTTSATHDQNLSDTLSTQRDPNFNISTASSTASSSSLDDSPAIAPAVSNNLYIGSTTLTVPGQSASQKFVIKIQLTKMEPGNFQDNAAVTNISSSVANNNNNNNNNNTTGSLDNNLNLTRPMVNVTFMKNIQCDANDHIIIENKEEIKLNNLDVAMSSVSHSIDASLINNFVNNFSKIQLNEENETQHLQEVPCSSKSCYNERDHRTSVRRGESSIHHDFVTPISVIVGENDEQTQCCKRRKTSNPYPTKWRCCKCACSSFTNDTQNANEEDSSPSSACRGPSKSTKGSWTSRFNCVKREKPNNENSDMAMWIPPDNAAFLSLPQPNQNIFPTFARCPEVLLVTLNYPQSVVVGPLEDHDERDRSERIEVDASAHPISEIGSTFANVLSSQKHWPHILCSPTFGPVVHSQVDYIHCLVPDLNKITNSSFYWGKMDRYEAERLLEGKAEGTFLLRDSAQEEYLFSVTFRKYGRSLHARIEQFNHKFSFDCHDPGVFTATTVTGLLEHYKDPSCVMFFEPMLTIPLHRNFTFSLQQLCRATIVSHTTYDGINELHLPNSLKAYLKEYHYKLRVRVKPFDEPFYSCS